MIFVNELHQSIAERVEETKDTDSRYYRYSNHHDSGGRPAIFLSQLVDNNRSIWAHLDARALTATSSTKDGISGKWEIRIGVDATLEKSRQSSGSLSQQQPIARETFDLVGPCLSSILLTAGKRFTVTNDGFSTKQKEPYTAAKKQHLTLKATMDVSDMSLEEFESELLGLLKRTHIALHEIAAQVR